MTVGKNKKVVSSKKKGGKKRITDPFARKDWYEVKAPQMFVSRDVMYTIATRSAGMKDAKDSLRGRVYTVSLAELKPQADDESYRKISLKAEEIHGKAVLTNFHGMDLTRDKLCSLIRKKQTLIECHTDVKTADGYLMRLFCIGLTTRRKNQLRLTSYAQSAQVRTIRKKMVEILQKEAKDVDMSALVEKLISDSIGKEIEKACQGIYPVQSVFIRKVKTLRAPRLDVAKLLELHGGAAAVADIGMVEHADAAPAAAAAVVGEDA